jgi:prepilin-type N-terminal cleavage/methylation domain-containing protein
MKAHSDRRAGMTLVELLVVVAIMGVLAVAVLPNLANTGENRRSREAARMVTSFISKAQSRALGRLEWAGFAMVPIGPSSQASLDLFLADVPEAFRGDGVNATASGNLTAGKFNLTFTNAFTSGTALTSMFVQGDLIRFDGRGPWFSLLTQPTLTSATTATSSCTLRTADAADAMAGQTVWNTPWPAPSVQHTFEILRQPQRSGSPLSLGEGRCIDLSWSGYGQQATYQTWGILPPNTTVFILFDGSGKPRQVVAGASRVIPDGPIFLLIGRADRAGRLADSLSASDDTVGANWQYADSSWVAIDPFTGLCKSAPCAKGAASVAASQAYIRAALSTGGL